MTTSTRIALSTAIAAAGLWSLKSVAIGFAGGLGKSPLEGPFFLTGLAAFVAASAALGVALTRGRPTWLRVLAGAVAPVAGFLTAMVLDALVGSLVTAGPDRHWVWTEFNLWVIATAGVGLALTARRREVASRADLY